MLQSKVKPDSVSFLAILSACGHAGLIDEGCHYFNQMMNIYGIKPGVEHYSCLIDLLGRAGRLHEAYEILHRNPEIRDDVRLLSALVSACRLHKNIDLGAEIARILIDKDPDDSSAYILLSNMYASAHKWDEVRKVRSKMKELRLKKNPGCSWIEINQKILPFFVEDNSHLHLESVNKCLSYLTAHMDDESKPFIYHFDVETETLLVFS